MASDDLIHWRDPKIMLVQGPDVPVAEMDRMIDAYLFQDKDDEPQVVVLLQRQGACSTGPVSLPTAGHGRCGVSSARPIPTIFGPGATTASSAPGRMYAS